MTPREVEAVAAVVAAQASLMLAEGLQGTTVYLPDLAENWIISREPA